MAEEGPPKLCFVVGPIGAEDSQQRIGADWLLEMIIQPVFEAFPQFEVKRADTISDPGMIDAQIINALLTADLVIADLSTLNPNAFYEIGIRHMAQRPVIHMQVAEESIPFDVSLFRSIKYSRTRPRDLRTAQAALRAQIEAILAPGYQVDNPITRTRGAVALEHGATSGEKILLEQIRALEARLAHVEKGFSPQPKRSVFSDLPGVHTIKFRNPNGITNEQAELLVKYLTEQFGVVTRIARNKTNLIVAMPRTSSIPPPIYFARDSGLQDLQIEYNRDVFD